MTGSYEKRSTGWSVRYVDQHGKHRRKSGFELKADAAAWLADRLRAERDGYSLDHDMKLDELVAMYLMQHQASAGRLDRLRYALKHSQREFGGVRIEKLDAGRLRVWAKQFESDNLRYSAVSALRQVLKFAVDERLLRENPAKRLANPMPAAAEAVPFDSWDEVRALDAAMPAEYRGLATFLVGTGLRPQEWVKLEWRHVDLAGRALHLPAHVVKHRTPERKVPLRQAVVEVLSGLACDSGLVWGCQDGREWREDVWYPSLERAGLARRRPYDTRHTYATWALRAGMNTFQLARRMGTSLDMIDKTYGKFASDGEAHELMMLDAYDALSHVPVVGQELGKESEASIDAEVVRSYAASGWSFEDDADMRG